MIIQLISSLLKYKKRLRSEVIQILLIKNSFSTLTFNYQFFKILTYLSFHHDCLFYLMMNLLLMNEASFHHLADEDFYNLYTIGKSYLKMNVIWKKFTYPNASIRQNNVHTHQGLNYLLYIQNTPWRQHNKDIFVHNKLVFQALRLRCRIYILFVLSFLL